MESCIWGATFRKAQTVWHIAVLKTAFNLALLKTSYSRCAQVSRQSRLPEAVFLNRSCSTHSGCARITSIPFRFLKSLQCSVAFEHRRLSPGRA